MKNTKGLYLLGIQVLLIFLWTSLQGNTRVVESYFSDGIFPIISYIPKIIGNMLPFSWGDLLYLLLILVFIRYLYRVLKALLNKQFPAALTAILVILNLGLGLYNWFHISWGMNYYRVPVERALALQRDTVYLADYLQLLQQHIDSANTLKSQLTAPQADFAQLSQQVEQLVAQDTLLQGYLTQGNLHVKRSNLAALSSAIGVSGYLNPFTMEAHVNQQAPLFTMPFTMVHELAHQQGVGFEDEANFIAFERLRYAADPYLRYSAYYQALVYMLMELHTIDPGLYANYLATVDPKVQEDIAIEREFWRRKTGWLSRLSGIFYNAYLQHNNQEEGLARYNRMTRLMLVKFLQAKGC